MRFGDVKKSPPERITPPLLDIILISTVHSIEYEYIVNRTVPIIGGITDEYAANICSQLRLLAASSDDDITIRISSPGGSVTGGWRFSTP
jgi:ATP-dependent protease ClpP protease subunit